MKRAFAIAAILLLAGWSAYRFCRNRTGEAQAGATAGQLVYLESCAACHGQRGDGKGPEAGRLATKPRDFSGGIYKFRSTDSGSLPLDEDIFRSISRRVRTTSMLAQLHLPEKERWAVTAYLKTFSPGFEAEKTSEPILFRLSLLPMLSSLLPVKGCIRMRVATDIMALMEKETVRQRKNSKVWGEPIFATDLTLKTFQIGA